MISTETNPHGHVSLGTDTDHFFFRSNSGEVTRHVQEPDVVALSLSVLPSTSRERLEAVEVTSEGVVEGTLTKSPSDAASLEVISSGVEDNSGDGVDIFRDGSSTDEVQGAAFSVVGVVDGEITLIIEVEFISVFGTANFDGNGSTVDVTELRLRNIAKGVETEFRFHDDLRN